MPLLEIQHLTKSYPDGWRLDDITFAVERGEIMCLLGPSGCGKTTLLRLIAGLERPEHGRLVLAGRDVTDVPTHLRGLGLMFQEYALFPHQDVFGNVAFGLRMHGLSGAALRARVDDVLELVGLAGFEKRDVAQLSGGERQRVALARSLAPEPALLMLDEPLGALDRAMRERLLDELPGILQRAGVTAITVTHDQEEAFAIADRLVLMNAGCIVQSGRPEAVYRHPASNWVAHFLGLTNVLDAHLLEGQRVETSVGTLVLRPDAALELLSEGEVSLLIRPEAARIGCGAVNAVEGTVLERSFRGEYYRVRMRHVSDVELTFTFPADSELPPVGEVLPLTLDPNGMTLVSSSSDVCESS
ncbi:MAG: ABC transporter ATP-binding protein [Chloroflexi bacterium]|nr:ABC transporter ATP-binding protein [Chloroflexota bacterium]